MSNETITTGEPKRFPPWMKKKIAPDDQTANVHKMLKGLSLTTVCQNAVCPNICECFGKGTATFMILGKDCSRSCRFCAVGSWSREAIRPLPTPDPEEPVNVARAVKELNLRYAVVTSVTRDDLPDGGAGHFAKTIRAIKELCDASVEVLVPDFMGSCDSIKTVMDARPDVFNHNIETVPRLYESVRPQADYRQSLDVLEYVGLNSGITTKSGMMVGLGESPEEVHRVMQDLRTAGCNILTLGQYLAPTEKHHPMKEFVTPDQFSEYEKFGKGLGFSDIVAGAFVRSSYHAGETYDNAKRSTHDTRDKTACHERG